MAFIYRLPSYILIVFLLSLVSLNARADETILSCKIENSSRSLLVTLEQNNVVYRFGKAGQKPELTLTENIKTIEYYPWQGIGRYISESVVFKNKGHRYSVYFAFDKLDEENGASGGITVSKGDNTLADLTCQPKTITMSLFSLSDAKEIAGLCWSIDNEKWIECR